MNSNNFKLLSVTDKEFDGKIHTSIVYNQKGINYKIDTRSDNKLTQEEIINKINQDILNYEN